MYRSRMFIAAVLLICLFPLLSGAAAARPLAVKLAALAAPITTAFTYQGHLNDDGSPANGSYDFRFILYNALDEGAQVGSTVTESDVAVTDGLFTVALDFGAVFDGVALWLEISVRPGASGEYTILTPRQPLTATPYAIGLLPGAIVKQGASNPALSLDSAGDGLYIGHANDKGIYICATGTQTECTPTNNNNGLEIGNAQNTGLRVQKAGGTGVIVVSAGADGLRVSDAGESGLEITHSDGTGVFICATGTKTGCTPSGNNNGIEIGNAQSTGLRVQQAGGTGVIVNSAGGFGVNVRGDAGAGYFGGDIQVDGSCTGCSLATFAVNASDQPLQPGDVVTVQGVQASGVDSVPVLMSVVPANAGQSIVGVVNGRAEIHMDDETHPDTIGRQLISRDGPAQPGDYVTIITYGLALVNVGDSLSARSITAGSKLALDAGGSARSLKTAVVEGIQIAESAPTVGLALSNPDEQGQVWVLVNPQ